MNIREAILKAADVIDQRPEEFNFGNMVPDPACGSPGCALGWIAFLADEARFAKPRGKSAYREWISSELFAWMGVDEGEFYDRMDEFDDRWINSAKQCAAAMRLYADKYHPAPSLGIPESVRAIFETKQSELVP